jgi:phenylacetate-CoA ligase
MDLVALLARSVVFPALAVKSHSREPAYARTYRRTQFLSADELCAYQFARLQSLLRHLWARSPYYARALREAGLSHPDEVRQLDDLARLPLLSKETLREQQDELRVTDAAYEPVLEKRTSGSTGVPLKIAWSEQARQHKAALTARHNAWAGYRPGDSVGLVWGDVEAPTTWRGRLRAALLERAEVLDSQRLDDARMARFTDALRRRGIRTLLGHAQPLCHYAHYLREHGLSELPVRAVIPTAMALHPGQRGLLEQAFGAQVFERYGSEETSIIASECPAHRGLHLAAEGLIVELVREGRPVAPGEEGEIVITDLVNYHLPLLRYRIGDVGALATEPCSCGRGLPLLARLAGRIADSIVTPDGRTVSGISITDHLVEVEGIRQVQLVQEARDQLVFRLVRDARFTAQSEALLRTHCARIFGPAMRIRCEFVVAIPTGPRGKYPLCISHLAEGGDGR